MQDLRRDLKKIKLEILIILYSAFNYRNINSNDCLRAFDEIDKNNINHKLDYYLNIVKGFNMGNIREFLIGEEVYDEDSFKEALKKVKYLKLLGSDAKIYCGIYNKGIIIPRVRDDVTTLIAIHELVHNSLLMNKDIIRDAKVVNSESLPIFYEMLYSYENKYVKCDIHEDKYADILLNTYEAEPMLVQAKKLSKLLKRD